MDQNLQDNVNLTNFTFVNPNSDSRDPLAYQWIRVLSITPRDTNIMHNVIAITPCIHKTSLLFVKLLERLYSSAT